MFVRMLSGPRAGEIVNLPFRAAGGVLRGGVAELVIDPELRPVATKTPPPHVVVPPDPELEEEAPINHHKRAGRRR